MLTEYSKEQLWKTYETLPQELKEAIFSEETANNIWDICSRNGIEDERVSEVARYTGRVLMGLLPPEEFQKSLEKDLKLGKEVVKKVNQEINRFVFYPVKTSLEELYKIEIAPPAGMPKVGPPLPSEEKEEPEKRKGPDVYRESIE